MIDEVELLLAKIRKYDPNFCPKSTGKYLLTGRNNSNVNKSLKR
ncbi:hypothetical protein ACPV79_002957 [Listeria monocytogenes]